MLCTVMSLCLVFVVCGLFSRFDFECDVAQVYRLTPTIPACVQPSPPRALLTAALAFFLSSALQPCLHIGCLGRCKHPTAMQLMELPHGGWSTLLSL